jgi:hypothetical protein
MGAPGFTAAASLYESTGRYAARCGRGGAAARASLVRPAQLGAFGPGLAPAFGGFFSDICGPCRITVLPGGELLAERHCVQTRLVRKCETFPGSPGGGAIFRRAAGQDGSFPDFPDIVICRWEVEIVGHYTKPCFPEPLFP